MYAAQAIGAGLAHVPVDRVQDARDDVQAARGDLVQRVAAYWRLAIERAEMAVARQQHDAVGVAGADRVEQSLALEREIAPTLPAMALGQHLDGGNQQPHLGGLSQLGREPRPLLIAEHGLGRIGIGHIALLAERIAPVGPPQRGAEPAQVEQDDLHAHARRADDVGAVDAFAGAPYVVGGDIPEAEEFILGDSLVREIGPAVVPAIVMIVPDREMRHLFPQPGVTGDLAGNVIGLLESSGVGGVEVAVDVVAGEDEQIGLAGQHGIPDWLWPSLLGA